MKLSDLVTGGDLNPRITGREIGAAELESSILSHGLLAPIIARELPGGSYQVIDGNRRLAALRALVVRGEMTEDEDVPVQIYRDESDAAAREIALAANIIRKPLHPVDQFEAFSRLADDYSPEQIAERFGVTPRLVRQRMSLGALHPELRAAWREGILNESLAQVFTLARDQDQQIKVFQALSKDHRLYEHSIKNALGVDRETATALAVVGVDAYRAAGGEFTDDLFGDDIVVHHPEIAQRLLSEKIEAVCDELRQEGWSFAVDKGSIKDSWNWRAAKPADPETPTPEEQSRIEEIDKEVDPLQAKEESGGELTPDEICRLGELEEELEGINRAIQRRRYSGKQKKKLGCFVGVSHNDTIAVTVGVAKPKEAKVDAKAQKTTVGANEKPAAEKPELSNAMALALSAQLTAAAAKTLANEPNTALRFALATLEQGHRTLAMRINISGLNSIELREHPQGMTFEASFAEIWKMPLEDVMRRFAEVVSNGLDLRRQRADQQLPEGTDTLLKYIGGVGGLDFDGNALSSFDVTYYFEGVNASLCHRALDEMGIDKKGRPAKKGDLVKFCISKAALKGWVPPEMRRL